MSQAPSRLSRALLAHLALLFGCAMVFGQDPAEPGPQLNAPAPSALTPPLTPDERTRMRRPIVLDVRIVGNHHTKDVQVFDKIKTRRDAEFDPERLEKDVRSLDATGRFRNIITHKKTTQDGIIVTFELIERPFIQYIEHVGNRGLSEKKLAKEHGLKKGDALSPFNVREGRRKVEELYHQNGFPKATVLIQEGRIPTTKGWSTSSTKGRFNELPT